jgi:hypothetical protein
MTYRKKPKHDCKKELEAYSRGWEIRHISFEDGMKFHCPCGLIYEFLDGNWDLFPAKVFKRN